MSSLIISFVTHVLKFQRAYRVRADQFILTAGSERFFLVKKIPSGSLGTANYRPLLRCLKLLVLKRSKSEAFDLDINFHPYTRETNFPQEICRKMSFVAIRLLGFIFESHTAELAPSVRELAEMEYKAQTSFLTLQHKQWMKH